MPATRPEPHKWEFKARFRRGAFGWRSAPAVQRVKQAVAEISRVARKDPAFAAEGAVTFLERVSPAIEGVDSSSGSLGTAVRNAIKQLVPIVAAAPVDAATHAAWLDRLWAAFLADGIPYIEHLGDLWADLCSSPDVASGWADRLLEPTRHALDPTAKEFRHFKGTSACLSCVFAAGRHQELLDVLGPKTFWPYLRWGLKARAALGRADEALAIADANPATWVHDDDNPLADCEALLLAAGRVDEAYARYGLRASSGPTYLATFRAIARKYPKMPPATILADLVRRSPADAGMWFATAVNLGLLSVALDLARRSPCDPRTLTRAGRDRSAEDPAFAVEAGVLALQWLAEGHGYEITAANVLRAHDVAMHAAAKIGTAEETRGRIGELARGPSAGARFVASELRRLGLA